MVRNADYYMDNMDNLLRILKGCRQHGYILASLMVFGGPDIHKKVLDFTDSVNSDYFRAKTSYDLWIAGYGPSTVLEGQMNSIFRKYGLGEE